MTTCCYQLPTIGSNEDILSYVLEDDLLNKGIECTFDVLVVDGNTVTAAELQAPVIFTTVFS